MPNPILLIEDSQDIREAIDAALSSEGFQLTHASTGEEGLKALQSSDPFDLIILDWLMPGMNGESFLSRVNQMTQFRNVPVLVISASEKTRSHPAVKNFLSKPFSVDDLISRVRNLIRT